jgi:hypothetical protein
MWSASHPSHTSDSKRASSGSFGAHRIGSVISLMLISKTAANSASSSLSINWQPSSIHCCMRATRRSIVRGSP